MTIQLNRRGFLRTLAAVALLGRATVKAAEPISYKPGYHMIPIKLLRAKIDERQPRWGCHHKDLFVKSVKDDGVLVPILADESLLVIDGMYRLKAAELAGLTEVPVQVLNPSNTIQVQCEMMLRSI